MARVDVPCTVDHLTVGESEAKKSPNFTKSWPPLLNLRLKWDNVFIMLPGQEAELFAIQWWGRTSAYWGCVSYRHPWKWKSQIKAHKHSEKHNCLSTSMLLERHSQLSFSNNNPRRKQMDAHSKGIVDKLSTQDPSPKNMFADFSVVSSVTNKQTSLWQRNQTRFLSPDNGNAENREW